MNFTQTWNEEFKKNTSFIDRNSLMNVCEIGAFEALTTNYITSELLAHNGHITCVDPLDPSYALDGDGSLFQGQYERFMENTEAIRDKVILLRTPSDLSLPLLRGNSFDLIYVDGDHTFNSTYLDSIQAFRICKVGGYILWDDFEWGNTKPVKAAIEKFLSEITNYRLLLKLNQVLIQKLPEGSPTEDGQDEYQKISCEKLFNENTIHAAYCNLTSRHDRNDHMIAELNRVGIKAERQRSFPWEELYNTFTDDQKQNVEVMKRRTPGAIGCYYSQMAVMREALANGKNAFVCEDDLIFCDDLPTRLNIIYQFLNQHEWDVFWFGGTYHKEPTWHKVVEGKHTHPELQLCKCNLNRDWEPTFHPNIVRTYGAFSTHAYLVNKNRIEHVLSMLERVMPISMGIDWSFILEQPNMFTYAFNPGCIRQYGSQSDISKGFNAQDFSSLGPHWFANEMNSNLQAE